MEILATAVLRCLDLSRRSNIESRSAKLRFAARSYDFKVGFTIPSTGERTDNNLTVKPRLPDLLSGSPDSTKDQTSK